MFMYILLKCRLELLFTLSRPTNNESGRFPQTFSKDVQTVKLRALLCQPARCGLCCSKIEIKTLL